jgi:hypothetical protein
MSRRVWSGILAGVLAAMALLGVAAGAYRLGRHDTVVRTVRDGEVVRVVGHGWGYGPGPGFFLFPLLLLGLVALLLWGRRGWGGGHAYCGPGPWARGEPQEAFDEWHQRAHSGGPSTPPPVPPGGGPGATGPAPPTV